MLTVCFLGKKPCIDTTGQKSKRVWMTGCVVWSEAKKLSEIQSFKH